MAKRKPQMVEGKMYLLPKQTEVESTETITWQHVFNANDQTDKVLTSVRATAKKFNYRYFALDGCLYRIDDHVPVTGLSTLGTHTDALIRGVVVTVRDDRTCTVVALARRAWVVMEATWHYNDENYSRGDGGSASHVFTTKEAAERAAREQNLDEAERTDELFEFVSNGWDASAYGEMVNMPWPQWRDWLMDHDFAEADLPKVDQATQEPSVRTLSDWWETDACRERVKIAIEHLDLPFYTVEEVSLE